MPRNYNQEQPESVMDEMSPLERMIAQRDALVSFMPDANDRESFEQLIGIIPKENQAPYYARLKGYLAHPNQASGRGGVRGMLFELGLVRQVMCDGLERLDFDAAKNIGTIAFNGYSKNANFQQPPNKQMSSLIEIDVPICRDGKPYAYEAKTYFRMSFGSSAGDRNQILKYQAAIDCGKISGATLLVKGLIDEKFLQWISSRENYSPAPDIEVLYSLQLPSGEPYISTLKPGKQEGLRFHNTVVRALPDIIIANNLDAAAKSGILGTIITDSSREVGGANALSEPEEIENRKRIFVNYLHAKLAAPR